MRRYDALLLDADDTVFDFNEGERRALPLAFRRAGIPESAIPDYHRINDGLWEDLEKGLVTQSQLKLQRFTDLAQVAPMAVPPEEAAAIYMEELGRQAVYIPGAYETVRRIAREMPVAIVTNGISEVQRIRFRLSGLDQIVQAMVISEEVGCSKPDPAMLFYALEKLGVSPERALMAGDSLKSDILAANRAGVDAVWYNPQGAALPPEYQAKYIIRDIRELANITLG